MWCQILIAPGRLTHSISAVQCQCGDEYWGYRERGLRIQDTGVPPLSPGPRCPPPSQHQGKPVTINFIRTRPACLCSAEFLNCDFNTVCAVCAPLLVLIFAYQTAYSQVVIFAQNCVHSYEALVCPIHNLNYIIFNTSAVTFSSIRWKRWLQKYKIYCNLCMGHTWGCCTTSAVVNLTVVYWWRFCWQMSNVETTFIISKILYVERIIHSLLNIVYRWQYRW